METNIRKNVRKPVKSSIKENFGKKIKLIFFIVHGLEGTPFDMRHFRAAIKATIPDAVVFLADCNSGMTNDSIVDQGKRFADNVQEILFVEDRTGHFIYIISN